jgi:hypothetical protein
MNALAIRGAAVAKTEPLSAELRNRQPDDASRRGFDIGMAAAEGQTLPGPGKEKIRYSLPIAEQRGFDLAVSFSLERNRNADFAAKGAAIARVDPKITAARTAETDVFYWLGFDIATGIFGNPALGGQGHTSTGPGSLQIRDSLSPTGQRGFNAAVKLLLGQDLPSPRPRAPRTSVEVVSVSKSNPVLHSEYGDLSKLSAVPPSNEILCRGGESKFIFTAENSKVASTGESIIVTLLTFEPGPNAAGQSGEGLRPGECAWVDRPINGRFLIRFETPVNAQLKQQINGSPVDASPIAAERYPDAGSIPVYMSNPDHYWSFFGGKPINNFLTATGNKYFRRPVGQANPTALKHVR